MDSTVHILFTDETNMPSDPKAKFFAYGGLIVPATALAELDRGIAKIRTEAGYGLTDELKFDTRSRPKHVTMEACTKAKQEVIQLCIKLGCRFIVYVVLHAIAKGTSQADMVRWGADHVIGKFNYYLGGINGYGIVAVDRLPKSSEYLYLSDKFTGGLVLQDGTHVALDRVKLFASTCINASHVSSAMDIVLGSFRYCINQPKNVEAAKVMMKDVTALVWCQRDGETIYAFERGLIFRPKEVKVDAYKKEYDVLIGWINELIADDPPAPGV
jgi:hypothetical protein